MGCRFFKKNLAGKHGMFQHNIKVPVSVPIKISLAELIIYRNNVTERSPYSENLGWMTCGNVRGSSTSNEASPWNRIMITTRPYKTAPLPGNYPLSRNNAGTAAVPNGKPTKICKMPSGVRFVGKNRWIPFSLNGLGPILDCLLRIPSWVQYHLRIPFYPTWSCWYAWALLLQKSHQYQPCILDPRPLRFQPTATGSASLETSLVRTAPRPVDTAHDAAVSSSCPLHPLWGDLCIN